MSFTVEKGVPQTSSRRGRRPTQFPLADMEVGDSFLIECNPDEKKEVDSWRRKLLIAKKRFSEQYEGGKFTTGLQVDADEDGRKGLRVWRAE